MNRLFYYMLEDAKFMGRIGLGFFARCALIILLLLVICFPVYVVVQVMHMTTERLACATATDCATLKR